MKALLLICLSAFFQPLLSSASEVSVFEVKTRSQQISREAIYDRVDSDSDHTELSMYAPAKKLKSFKLGEQSLGDIFEQAQKDTEGHAFFGRVKKFLLRDDKTQVFYLIHLESDARSPYKGGRFQIGPLDVLAGEWLVPTRSLYPSENALIIEHLKAQ